MSNVFFTSDEHFNHKYVAALRGFGTISYDDNGNRHVEADLDAYNNHIITVWNSHVTKDDTVWLLGDASLGTWEQAEASFRQLNGTIHLITGNHDRCWPGNRNSHDWQHKYMQYFRSVQPFARRKIEGKVVLLSHFPYDGDHVSDARPNGEDRDTQYRLRNEGQWLLHGHTHQSHIMTGLRMLHVGWDTWHAPVPLETVSGVIRKEDEIAS